MYYATECFNPYLCADCGQAFRWRVDENEVLTGVIADRVIRIKKDGDGYDFDCDEVCFEKLIVPYFDLNRDYKKILDSYTDEHIKACTDRFYGIRILKQDEWESICSFIISQNNNIPRIKGIIERLCENFGNKIEDGFYTFPSAQKLAGLSVEDLASLRAGFRAKYILDAAQKISSGELDIQKLKTLELDELIEQLMKIKGVGLKVASCAALFGFGKIDAFPIDVWVKRILEKYYPDGLPKEFDGTRGIAQQYLFKYEALGN